MSTLEQNKKNMFTILIIDDDITSIMMLKGWLQRDGYGVISSTDGNSGYDRAKKDRPDIIMLDVDLGKSWGPEICKQLKNTVETSEIPVLFLSASVDVKTKLQCFEAGGQDYITKPYEPHEVLARVRTHIRLAQVQRLALEMQAARISELARAQQALLPPNPSELPEARFAVHLQQLSGAGGDFYDIVQVSDHIFDYIVADVSGHDIGIALVTSALKTLFKQNCTSINSPAMILSLTNKIIPAVLQSGQFVCISWLRVNRITGRAVVINAGQPPILYLPIRAEPRMLDISGDLVGAFEHVVFDEQEFSVEPGDRFLLYSDGIVELGDKSPAARESGIIRLNRICSTLERVELNCFLQNAASKALEGVEPEDDIVILGVEV